MKGNGGAKGLCVPPSSTSSLGSPASSSGGKIDCRSNIVLPELAIRNSWVPVTTGPGVNVSS